MKTGLLFALAAVASNEGVLAARLGEIVKSKLPPGGTGGMAVPKVAGKGETCNTDWPPTNCEAGYECKVSQADELMMGASGTCQKENLRPDKSKKKKHRKRASLLEGLPVRRARTG